MSENNSLPHDIEANLHQGELFSAGEVGPEQDQTEYELLVGHRRTDGTYKTTEQLRTEYIQRTDELIRLMTEGVDVDDPVTGERSRQRPDVVVYLDKSARPVSWLVRELWDKLAPAPGEAVPEMPETRFVNIDREQWVNTVDPYGKGHMNIDLVDDSVVRSLRSIFVDNNYKQSGLSEELDSARTQLDNKTVLIVDEVFTSGRTLTIAERFFQRAFPTARIAGAYWMKGIAQKKQATGNADLPVWYKEDDVRGRGVANRDERLSQRSHSLTQRLGGWFLSTGFKEMDPASLQLRKELHKLANDPEVLIVPSNLRDMDDYDRRAEALNGMDLEQFMAEKRAMNARAKQAQKY